MSKAGLLVCAVHRRIDEMPDSRIPGRVDCIFAQSQLFGCRGVARVPVGRLHAEDAVHAPHRGIQRCAVAHVPRGNLRSGLRQRPRRPARRIAGHARTANRRPAAAPPPHRLAGRWRQAPRSSCPSRSGVRRNRATLLSAPGLQSAAPQSGQHHRQIADRHPAAFGAASDSEAPGVPDDPRKRRVFPDGKRPGIPAILLQMRQWGEKWIAARKE